MAAAARCGRGSMQQSTFQLPSLCVTDIIGVVLHQFSFLQAWQQQLLRPWLHAAVNSSAAKSLRD
jgi:hypothetical protein